MRLKNVLLFAKRNIRLFYCLTLSFYREKFRQLTIDLVQGTVCTSKLTWHEKNEGFFYFLQRTSMSGNPARPCECFSCGFQACVLYPANSCHCSSSCNFVDEYLSKSNHSNCDRVEVISMRSFSGVLTPVNGEDGDVNSAKMLNGAITDLSR